MLLRTYKCTKACGHFQWRHHQDAIYLSPAKDDVPGECVAKDVMYRAYEELHPRPLQRKGRVTAQQCVWYFWTLPPYVTIAAIFAFKGSSQDKWSERSSTVGMNTARAQPIKLRGVVSGKSSRDEVNHSHNFSTLLSILRRQQ